MSWLDSHALLPLYEDVPKWTLDGLRTKIDTFR